MIKLSVIRDLSRLIVHEFKPQRIVLFGSYAYGQPTSDSDVDLLVILPFRGSALRKAVEILNRINPDFPVDLLARRPDDTRRRHADGVPLIREVFGSGSGAI